MNKFKSKLLTFNFFSIVLVAVFIFGFFGLIAYNLSQDIVKTSNDFTKDFYIKTQKDIIKNQVNNFIEYIKNLREIKTKEIIGYFDKLSDIPCRNIKYSKNPKKALDNFAKCNNIKIILVKNGKILFSNTKINLNKLNLNRHLQKRGDKYYLIKHIAKNYFFIIVISQKRIDDEVKKEAVKYLYSIRFGAKNNGYISIAEILNYKGGKKFARVVALPVKPQWIGKYLDDDKKDAKGKLYRKEYLKIANTTQSGYVSYWFFKKDKKFHPKISYVRLYKPYNWLIFSSVYLDDIDSVIKQRNKIFYRHIRKYIYAYVAGYIIMLLAVILIAKYENKIFHRLITLYETEIEQKNIKLKELNKNLAKMVAKKTKEALEKYFKDNLTNLSNREKLLNDLSGNFVAVLNINSFKEINDFYGIKAGDIILKEVASRLLNFTQNVYKLSADEYAIIDAKEKSLLRLIKKINASFKDNPVEIDNEKIYLSFRAGIGKNLQEADLALKYAKEKNRNVIVFSKKLPVLKEFENNLKWKRIIYNAIKENNVIPFVQGIIDNKTKQIVKYECLIRIKYKDKIYTPYFFLDIARKTNQYEMLQKIMIEKCFKKFSEIKKDFSINLDATDLENNKFKKWLLAKIDKYEVAEYLTVELLENLNFIDNEEINHFIKTLKEKHIKIAIDDFGSGYSNFVYLIKDLPTDILKIDGSIVKDIEKKEIYMLLKKIIEIAKEFNFITIAEFVENEKIYQKLRQIGVDYSQGYYFSKPFNIEDM